MDSEVREATDLLPLENEINNNGCQKSIKLDQQPEELEFNFKNVYNQILNLNNCQSPTQFTSKFSVYLIVVICCIIIALDIILANYLNELIAGQCKPIAMLIFTISILIFATFALSLQPCNSKPASFQVPLVPITPLLSILINIYLMFNLSNATWVRFGIWMIFGLSIYFFYGITNSNERYRIKPLQLPIVNDKQQIIK